MFYLSINFGIVELLFITPNIGCKNLLLSLEFIIQKRVGETGGGGEGDLHKKCLLFGILSMRFLSRCFVNHSIMEKNVSLLPAVPENEVTALEMTVYTNQIKSELVLKLIKVL